MGGSGSSGGSIPVGSMVGHADHCDLQFETTLYGPIPSVVTELRVGDLLTVQLIKGDHSQSVAALTQSKHEVAGTFAGPVQLGTLVSCLSQYNYVAEVKAISGSQVTVFVRRV